ncbi:MAG: cupredoxin domain-containing protein, partial [Thermomicrobiales bacterium]
TDAAAEAATPEAAAPVTEFTVTMGQPEETRFDPSEVTIPSATDVQVSVTNGGATPHNFSIDDLGISVNVEPGDSAVVLINAEPGDYEFYCNIPGHKEGGMVGTLHVE